ncbi:shikimate kinase [Staphylococcus hominis]
MTHSYLPLILVGFMGTGKSTIAKYLSSKLHYSYIDLDTYIETKEFKTIPDIFNEIGEKGFRKLEYKYLKDCIDKYDIISTGGGIIENDDSISLLKNKTVIWLDCDIDIIYYRIANDPHRPNAKNKSKKQLNSLYLSRVSRYNEIAFKKVDSSKSIEYVYETILNHIPCE